MGQLTHKLITRFLFKKPFYGKSLTHENRLKFMSSLAEKVIYENVEGDLIECGVYRGGSLLELGIKLKHLNSNKTLYGIDTFEGHPYSDEGTIHIKGLFNDTNYKKVESIINKLKLKNIKLIKGRFIDVFPLLKHKKFCFVHLDCDLYLSTKECLEFLFPRLSKGGIMYFDDYNSKSALKVNKIIEEFIDRKELVILHKKQAYYVKC